MRSINDLFVLDYSKLPKSKTHAIIQTEGQSEKVKEILLKKKLRKKKRINRYAKSPKHKRR